MFLVPEGTLQATQGETQTQTPVQLQPSFPSGVLPARNTSAMVVQSSDVTNQHWIHLRFTPQGGTQT